MSRCKRVESDFECTCHHATWRFVRPLGLPCALYAFSGGVAGLLTLILAAMDSQGLVASGEYLGAKAESDSVGTTSSSWWSSALSSEEGLGAGGLTCWQN